MRHEARLGDAVIVYDAGGNWRGTGTAWHLTEAAHQVVVAASGLVMAMTHAAFDRFPESVTGKVLHRSGDSAAPRRAEFAFHEGRKIRNSA